MMPRKKPTICFGLGLYNHAEYLPAALDSVLAQTHGDFNIVAVNDGSRDGTDDIMQEYTRADKRVMYTAREVRQGLNRTWKEVFLRAYGQGIDYFAWLSDHDVWHPEWLQAHLEILEHHPRAVMAYPLIAPIGPRGEALDMEPTRFETWGLNKRKRVQRTAKKIVGAGNMIYGLFRAEALKKCGGFPNFPMPDRLLMMELSTLGGFKLIERRLWYRRFFQKAPRDGSDRYKAVLQRQKRSLFPDGARPWHSHFPTLAQALGLVLHLGVKPPSGKFSDTIFGPYMAYMHLRRKKHLLKTEFLLFSELMGSRFNPFKNKHPGVH